MNEIRRHYFLDKWVIVSTERNNRPIDFEVEEINIQKTRCPFCSIDSPIYFKRDNVTVIPNKFPAVTSSATVSTSKEFLESKAAFGFHEIIIESEKHNKRFEELTLEEIRNVIDVFVQRTKQHMNNKRINYVSIFKNQGAEAGASISHIHSQLIALPVIPHLIDIEEGKMDEFLHLFGKCVFEKIYEEEKKENERVLEDTTSFFAIAPFASVFSGEVWIMPKRHVRTLFELNKNEILDFAKVLKAVLQKVSKIFPGIPYNFAIHQAPKGKDFHLHLELYPRINKLGGFELGNDMYINSLSPEKFTEEYKKVKL